MRWLLDSESERQIGEHWSLTRAEMEVFNIDPDLAPDLEAALFRFLAMIGHVSMDEAERRQAEADRKAWPGYERHVAKDGEGSDFDCTDAVNFMVKVCGLPMDQAVGWYWRWDARLLRDGLFEYPDEEVSAAYRDRRRSRLPLLQGAVAIPSDPPF